MGYGTNVYQTEFEYLFVIALEVLSFAVLSILITGINLYESLKQDDFKFLLSERLEETTVWLRKLQSSGEGSYLPAPQYSEIDFAVQDAFMYDFNMVVEEFNFFQMLLYAAEENAD